MFFSLSQIIALFRNRYRIWFSKKMLEKSQNVVINCFKAWKFNHKRPAKEFLLIILHNCLQSCFKKHIFKIVLLFCNSSNLGCSLVDFLYDLTNDFFENILRRLFLSKVYLCGYHFFFLCSITLVACYINCLKDYVTICYTTASFEKWSILQIH